jgi:hypothetical protein
MLAAKALSKLGMGRHPHTERDEDLRIGRDVTQDDLVSN